MFSLNIVYLTNSKGSVNKPSNQIAPEVLHRVLLANLYNRDHVPTHTTSKSSNYAVLTRSLTVDRALKRFDN